MKMLVNPIEVKLENGGFNEFGKATILVKSKEGSNLALIMVSYDAYAIRLSMKHFSTSKILSLTIDKASPLSIKRGIEELLNQIGFTSVELQGKDFVRFIPEEKE